MVKVILSRAKDVYISPNQRAVLANEAKVDLFISAHENSATNKTASGYEDYRSGSAGNVTKSAHTAFHNTMAKFFAKYGIKNRGMKTASYAVLRYTNMPAILLEHLFISNSADLKYQTDSAFTKSAAVAYANAIRAALKAIGKPNGTVMLDAGHGGADPGAVNGREHEKDHMLKLVLLIKKELENSNISTTKPSIAKPIPIIKDRIQYKVEDGANAFRFQSGKYDEEEAAVEAAERALVANAISFATIIGTKE